MKISYNWLKEFVNIPLAPEDLAERLLLLGFETTLSGKRGAQFSGVVVGQILEIAKHPNADRLSLCQVTDGGAALAVVCGAKNIAVGQKVPFARLGAKLPGGRVIERATIRGVESQGMLCSAAELGLAADAEGIYVLPSEADLGQDVGDLLAPEDAILEVEVTPNRPDVLSHYGLARELASYFRLPLERPSLPEIAGEGSPLKVSIEAAEACPRYLGRELSGLKVGPSPAWLSRRLESVGLRSINNVVDVTNYVLMGWGQPLHAFDADLLEENRLRVRFARAEEKLLALDGREYILEPDCLVIADARRPVALAGIIGGSETGVTAKTARVFLESAYFQPAVIRRTARRFKLRTDSSYRFERGADPEAVAPASQRAAALILELCKGSKATLPADHYPKPPQPPRIEVSWDRVQSLLATPVSRERAEERLKRLSDDVERTPAGWVLTPHSHRGDLSHVQDIVEEIARLDGYELIPEAASPVVPTLPHPHFGYALEETLRERAGALGFLEAYNYDFVSLADLERSGLGEKESLKTIPALENPLSADWQYLRPRLAIGLLKNLKHNLNRGADHVRLCELGKTYRRGEGVEETLIFAGLAVGNDPPGTAWQPGVSRPMDFFRLKGMVRSILAGWPEPAWQALPANETLLHPGLSAGVFSGGKYLGGVGLLHPRLAEAWDLAGNSVWYFSLDVDALLSLPFSPMRYRPLPTFPFVDRDLSVVFDEAVSWEQVQRTAVTQGRPLVKSVALMDVFAGGSIPKGRRSLTLRMRFQLPDRTLTDPEVEQTVQKTVRALETELKGQQRV